MGSNALSRSICWRRSMGITRIVMVVALVMMFIAPIEAAAYYDDDVPGVPIPASPVAGTLDESTDLDDVFSVDLAEGETLEVSITGDAGTDFDLFLFEPGAPDVWTEEFLVAAAIEAAYPDGFSYTVPAGEGGTYYLDVYAASGAGEYTLTWSIATGVVDDHNIPGVPIPASPVADTLNEMSDEDDVFSVDLAEGETLEVSITGDAGTDFDLFLFAPGSTDVWMDEFVAYAIEEGYPDVLSYTVSAGEGGTYYLDVYAGAGSGGYTLTWSVTQGVVVAPIAGGNRYTTAIAASKKAFPTGIEATIDGYKNVVVATGTNWPDALGGASLAGALECPILLTDPSKLPSEVAAEIERLGATRVVILGSTAAVSASVESALDSLDGVSTKRVYGANRYSTSYKVAEETVRVLEAKADDFTGTAFVATGLNFPDALGASPIAASQGWPLYLVNPTQGVTTELEAAMTRDGVNKVIALGSNLVVQDSVLSTLASRLGCATDRWAGPNRYDTARVIATHGVTDCGLTWDKVAITTGTNFPDALAGGALQGRDGSVMLLTPPTSLNSGVAATLAANKATIFEVRFLGSTAAVSQTVRDAVAAALR